MRALETRYFYVVKMTPTDEDGTAMRNTLYIIQNS